jgi:hypothetical protein
MGEAELGTLASGINAGELRGKDHVRALSMCEL